MTWPRLWCPIVAMVGAMGEVSTRLVYVVDDDQDLRTLLGRILRRSGHEVELFDRNRFYAAIGYGKQDADGWVRLFVPAGTDKPKPEGKVARAVKRVLGLGERAVKVQGLDDVMIHLASCCNPVRGEAIVGYITRGKGVSVHAAACPNVEQLMYDPGRRIDVEWGAREDGETKFQVKLVLEVEDRPAAPEDWERREKLRAVERAMARLSRPQRLCFFLHYVEGWDVGEIRDVLGVRDGTIKSHLDRARKKIRKTDEVLQWQTNPS